MAAICKEGSLSMLPCPTWSLMCTVRTPNLLHTHTRYMCTSTVGLKLQSKGLKGTHNSRSKLVGNEEVLFHCKIATHHLSSVKNGKLCQQRFSSCVIKMGSSGRFQRLPYHQYSIHAIPNSKQFCCVLGICEVGAKCDFEIWGFKGFLSMDKKNSP